MHLIPIVYATDLSKSYGFGGVNTVSDVIGKMMPAALSVAGLGVTMYLIIGAFKLLTSGGEKTAVSEAREMITHGLIGLVLLLLVFGIIKFILAYFNINLTIIG